MTHSRLVPLLLAVALVGAACGESAATPTLTSAPTAVPTPSPVPTSAPTVDPCADPASGASFELHTIDGLVELPLTAGDPGPAATINPTIVEETNQMLGGTALLELGVDLNVNPASVRLRTVTADFAPFEATESVPVEATIDGSTATLHLPGREVSGLLRVAATWSSACGEASGGGRLGLDLLDPSVAEGCPATSDGLQAQVVDLQKTTLRVGGPAGVKLPIGIVGWTARWSDAAAIDDIPQFAGWDTGVVVTVPAGSTMNVKDVLDGIDFTSLRLAFYRRADVTAWLAGTLDEIASVDVVRKNPSATGGVEVPLDFPPGQYVVEIQGAYQTPCLRLDTYAVLSVDRG